MEKLKEMMWALVDQVEPYAHDICEVDYKELGEAIDMIKDLTEAIYYCTVTDAMHNKDEWPEYKVSGHEGRSPSARCAYMQAKEMNHPKETKMKELERYMQELSQDIVEMVLDASIEERQMLQKKIAALATKIDT